MAATAFAAVHSEHGIDARTVRKSASDARMAADYYALDAFNESRGWHVVEVSIVPVSAARLTAQSRAAGSDEVTPQLPPGE